MLQGRWNHPASHLWPNHGHASLCYQYQHVLGTQPEHDKCKGTDIEIFLASLRAEHNIPGVLVQLKTLWLRHLKALYPEEVQDEAAARGACAEVVDGAVHAKATTPPPTWPGSPNAWEIVVVYKDAMGCSALQAGQAVPACLEYLLQSSYLQ